MLEHLTVYFPIFIIDVGSHFRHWIVHQSLGVRDVQRCVTEHEERIEARGLKVDWLCSWIIRLDLCNGLTLGIKRESELIDSSFLDNLTAAFSSVVLDD